MFQQDQQNKQKYILSSEIRMLEKQKRELLYEVERLDAAKGAEFSQYTQQIKDLSKRRNDLLEQVEKLRETMSILTEAYTSAKNSMETYQRVQQKDVEEYVRMARQKAQTILAEAEKERTEAEQLHYANATKEREINMERQTFTIQVEEYTAQSIALETRQRVEKERMQKAEEQLNAMVIEADKIKQEIKALHDQKEVLFTEILTTKQIQLDTLTKIEEQRKQNEIKETTLNQRSLMLDEKDRKLKDEQRLIDDRNATIENTIRNLRAKGVII